MKKLLFTLIAVVSLTSCDSVFSGNDFTKAENITKANEKVAKLLKDSEDLDLNSLDVTNVSYLGADLEQDISIVQVTYKENENTSKTKVVNLTTEKVSDFRGTEIQNEIAARMGSNPLNPEKQPMKFNAFDFSVIPSRVEDATKLVKAEAPSYILKSIKSYKFEAPAKGKKVHESFTLNYVDENEDTKMQGKQIVTNYYEVGFEVDDSGKVSIVQ